VAALSFGLCVLAILYIYSKQILKHRDTVLAYKKQLEAYKKLVPDLGSVIPMSHYREIVDEKNSHINEISLQLSTTEKELSELKSQQQSKSIRLGLISENILPFHRDFKYDVKDLVPMFKPIDYIVFAEDEIVFLEIKMGTSQLSEKQKKIRALINSGKIRFEEHRINENGYSVKESHGKKTKSESGN
jgi:predicted Holliday junction resolvase-like endonuclease